MSEREITRIIENSTFSMKAEGFDVSKRQQEELRAILEGKESFDAAKKRYIDQAKKWSNKEKAEQDA